MLKVFYINLADRHFVNCDYNKLRSFVTQDTLVEVAGYKNLFVQMTKIVGEAMVRYLLAHFFNLRQADFTIFKNIHGKPYIAGVEKVYFNISHSGDYIVCALSDAEVGIDIERMATARMNVAHRFFHPDEIQKLEAVNGTTQNALFFTYWSIKESFLKYIGTGLSRSLSSFNVKFENSRILIYEDELALPLVVTTCSIHNDYKCFVCSEQHVVPDVIDFTDFYQ